MNSLYERWFHVAKSLNGSADHKTHECQVCHLLVRVADHVLATYAKDEGECSETRHAFAIDHLFVRDSSWFQEWTSAKNVIMKRHAAVLPLIGEQRIRRSSHPNVWV
eukprot:scpid45042/ scgid32699/ 